VPLQERRAPHGASATQAGHRVQGAPRCNQPRRARHPDPQHRADEIPHQWTRLHGISTRRTDRQDFESRTKQIKALAFKRCPVPFLFYGAESLVAAITGHRLTGGVRVVARPILVGLHDGYGLEKLAA
jgi:hypothetical protein